MFNITPSLAIKSNSPSLLSWKGEINPNLATLMVATLAWAGEVLVIPEGTQTMMITRDALESMLLKKTSY